MGPADLYLGAALGVTGETDAMVAELVEEKKGGGGHSHGGMPDMGGMGGMDM